MNTTCSGEKNEAERIRYLVKEAMEVITKICFGDVLGPFKNLGFLVYGKRALDVGRSCDELMEKILKEHELKGKMESNEPKDFMDILLDIQQDHAAAINLTRTHIKAFIWVSHYYVSSFSFGRERNVLTVEDGWEGVLFWLI